MGNGVISLLWQLRCHCNPDYNQFSSLSNTTVVSIFPNPCLWRRSLRSNLGGIDLEKLHRATLTGFLKELRNPFACDADHRFDNKIKCPTGRASFSVEFPTVRSKTPVKCPGHALVRGLGGGGRGDGRFLNWLVHGMEKWVMSQIARIYFRLACILLAGQKHDFRMTNRNNSSARELLHSR